MAPQPKPVYIIDGARFSDFEGFVAECNRGFIRPFGGDWHGNLDAFGDYLSWADADYELVWKGAEKSRVDLGHRATATWLEGNSRRCHPTNLPSVLERLEQARSAHGPTLFDWLVEIIREEPRVTLRLE